MLDVGPFVKALEVRAPFERKLGTGYKLWRRRGEGGLHSGDIAGLKLFALPPSRQGKAFCPLPSFKGWKRFAPPLRYDLNVKLMYFVTTCTFISIKH